MKVSIGPHTNLYPHPALVVGTWSEDGTPNIATVAWGGICCSRPPCVAVSLRAATKTHGNIKAREAFTVGVPSRQHVAQVDYAGVATGHEENKFEGAGLTPIASKLVDAPYVDEFPFSLECKLLHTYELGLHTLYVGEILDVKAEKSVLNADGFPALEKVDPIVFSTGDTAYFGVGEMLQEAFAKRGRK